MKTLHLTNAWHDRSGGVATFYRALLAAAGRRRHEVRLVVPGESTWTEEINAWARIYHLRSPQAPTNPSYRMLLPHQFYLPGGAGRRILCEERPDLVEFCDKYTVNYVSGLLRTGRIPGLGFQPATVGLSCERMDVDMRIYLTGWRFGRVFARWYMKWVYFPFFDHHITVSDFTAQELRDAARGHKRERGVWVRPMGVDAGLFTPARRTAEARRGVAWRAEADESSTLLLYAGRVVPEKNLELLAAAMEALNRDPARDYRLLVAGDGILLPRLREEWNRRLPGQVAFLGHIKDRAELAGLYANCDVFVHPNPTEPYGLAPLEAMAAGTPVVAPASGGLTAYANQANAWLAEPAPEAFAEAVRAASPGAPGREAKLANARRTAEERDWPIIAGQYFDLYQEIHALVRDGKRAPALPPSFVSTAGNWLGMEV